MRVLFPLLLASLLFSSCEKALEDPLDYYPTVATESVVVQPDGSVLCTGRITSKGASEITAAGFCVSTSPVPQMLDNQGVGSINGDLFTVTYDQFSTTGTYYFRTWAANDNGYAYGDVKQLQDITTEPIVAPCSPAMNSVVLGGGLAPENYYPGQIFPPDIYLGVWEFQANTSSHHFTYRFGSALETRTFTTVTMDPGPGQVKISFLSGFTSGVLLNGSTVYVNEITPTQWEITVCAAPWGTSTRKLTTKFRVNA